MTAHVDNIPCICGDAECTIPYGLCHCGCGLTVNISKKNHTISGHIEGRPYKFRGGHYKRKGSFPVELCVCRDSNCTTSYGYCHCGCGQKTTISNYTKTDLFVKKGKPTRYVRGHTQEGAAFLVRGMCICRKEDCNISYGICHCGCGKKTSIPSHTESGKNYFKGVPNKYVTGHHVEQAEKRGKKRITTPDTAYTEKLKWARILSKYGITKDEYNSMLTEQGGVCAICRKENTRKYNTGLIVDHCHKTGKIRGLLCHKCNVSIGLLEESPDLFRKAIRYIMKDEISKLEF